VITSIFFYIFFHRQLTLFAGRSAVSGRALTPDPASELLARAAVLARLQSTRWRRIGWAVGHWRTVDYFVDQIDRSPVYNQLTKPQHAFVRVTAQLFDVAISGETTWKA